MASATARPIPAAQFALAIQDLPLESVYAKAREIENSIAHLQRSNAQLKEFSDSIRRDESIGGETREEVGDRECLEAISENDVVIERQRERVALLREEVVRRGRVWHDGDGGAMGAAAANGEGAVNGDGQGAETRGQGGRLTDEELRRRMADQLGGDEADEGGMHL